MKEISYRYRGRIERWNHRRREYIWHSGYSEDGSSGGALFPWMTKDECRKDAKKQGGKAIFLEQ